MKNFIEMTVKRRFASLFVLLCTLSMAASAVPLTDGLYAEVDTSMGSFTCRLDYVEAPITCANFVGLAEGTQSWVDPDNGAIKNDPYYDGLIFHRVIDGFMIQGGCPLGTGVSGPGYAFRDEFHTNLTHHGAGVLSMANSGPDSNGGQFFITLAATTHLDNKHSVFGEIVDGQSIVDSIGKVTTTSDRPDVDVVINQVDILRIGPDAQAFDVAQQPLPEVSTLDLSISSVSTNQQLSASISDRSDIYFRSSTNLVDWTAGTHSYYAQSNDWSQVIDTTASQEFYQGIQIFYPQANTNVPESVTGHRVSLQFSALSSELIFSLEKAGVGRYVYDGNTNSITRWLWLSEPYYDLQVESVGLATIRLSFSYDSVTNGTCTGHFYNGAWNSMGSGTFTDTLVP